MSENPMPSNSIEDLKTNVQFEDTIVNDRTKEYAPDRFGINRITFFGMEQKQNRMLTNAEQRLSSAIVGLGFEMVGDYGPGISLTEYNQVIRKDGEFYSLSSSVNLPFTTTGDWQADSSSFVLRGDAQLRQDLSNPNLGTALIGFDRTLLSQSIGTLSFFMSGDPYSLYEFAGFATNTQDPDMKTWDWTIALQSAFNAVPDGGTLFIPQNYFKINGRVTLEDKNINIVCLGTFILGRDHNSYIEIKRNAAHVINGAGLQYLPSKGDTFLYTLASPTPDPQNYIIAITSTEAEITRIGDPAYTPYTKNEANEIISSTYRLRAPIKLSYTESAPLNVSLYQKGTPVKISGLKIRVSDDGALPTAKTRLLVMKGASNISFENCDIDRTNSNWPGICIWMEECALLDWRNCYVRGFNSDAGDAYAWLGEISAFITMRECGFVDGSGLKQERGWSGRHNSHILIDNCRFSGVDDHFGHDYIVQNMTMTRGVGIAGGSLTVRNVVHRSESWPLVTLRADSPYADGDLIIENCSTNFCLLWSIRDTDARQTKRKTWDRIRVVNNYVEGRAARGAITVKNNLSTDIFEATSSMTAIGNQWLRIAAGSECFFFHGSTASDDGGTRKLWVGNVFFKDNIFTNFQPGQYSSVIDSLKTDRLISNANQSILYTSLSAWNSQFTDDNIGIDGGALFSFSDIAGARMFRGCVINGLSNGFTGSTGRTILTDCFINADPFNDSGFTATVVAMNGNTATETLPSAPGDIWNFKA